MNQAINTSRLLLQALSDCSTPPTYTLLWVFCDSFLNAITPSVCLYNSIFHAFIITDLLCLYCLLDYEHLEGRDCLDLSLYAPGLAVLVWVSSGADSKTSIQVQVIYLGDGPRELGRWSQRTLGGNRGRETAEGEKPISVLSNKLPVLLENLGDTVEHVPVLSPKRVEELGHLSTTSPSVVGQALLPGAWAPHHFWLVLFTGQVCSYNLKKPSGRVTCACCKQPSEHGDECQEIWVGNNICWTSSESGTQWLLGRLWWLNVTKQPSSTHCKGTQFSMSSMGKPHVIDMAVEQAVKLLGLEVTWVHLWGMLVSAAVMNRIVGKTNIILILPFSFA